MNTVSLRPANTARQQIDQYKAVYATTYGDKPLPRLGLTRHLYIAESDSEAQAIGQRGFRLWYDRFAYLWRVNDPRPVADDGGAALMATRAIFGSPTTVRAEIERQIEATGANYFVTRFAYGDLTYEESARSLKLFTTEVMPHFQRPSQ
jgi:alkanesulfonate monooxygenase SsuD/methylene tetrahydromethanopterin reductase-like flavin-dependent oxidoreductase (luciferase family)